MGDFAWGDRSEIPGLIKHSFLTSNIQSEIRAVFALLDVDNSGFITKGEELEKRKYVPVKYLIFQKKWWPQYLQGLLVTRSVLF